MRMQFSPIQQYELMHFYFYNNEFAKAEDQGEEDRGANRVTLHSYRLENRYNDLRAALLEKDIRLKRLEE